MPRIIESQKHYFPPRAGICGAFRTERYDLERSADAARYVARERYAWPGGYALFACTDDGGTLCADCCRAEYATIARTHRNSGWFVIGVGSAESCEETLHCDHCGAVIFNAED